MLSTMTMDTDSSASTEIETPAISAEQLLFKREVGSFSRLIFLKLLYSTAIHFRTSFCFLCFCFDAKSFSHLLSCFS